MFKCYNSNALIFMAIHFLYMYGGVSLNCHSNSQLKSDLKDLFKTAPEKIENTECMSE